MLSKFKLQTLKQKLWAIVAASFLARVIMFLVLPGTPSFLGPDEGTYANLVKWISESRPASDFPAYGKGLYLSSRSIILPASALYKLGLSELDSIRLVSTIYGLSTLIIVVFFILKMHRYVCDKYPIHRPNENLIAGTLCIFAFMPSHFAWSSLGLRESVTEFWLLASLITFYFLFHHQRKITFLKVVMLAGSIAFTFSARPQVGWVLGVSLTGYLILNLRNPLAVFLLPVVLCGVLLGSTLNLGTTGTTATTETTETTETTGSSLGGILNPILNAGEVVVLKQEVNQLDATSVIKTQSCPRETPKITTPPSKFDTYFCIAWRAPFMVSTFLFRPIIGLDVTSTSSLFAAIENFLWMGLFVMIFVYATKRRSISFLQPLLPAFIFFVLYVLGASAYQGNMGTGFRHKSLILWAVLLLIFALGWRKREETVKELRNNSQESAV